MKLKPENIRSFRSDQLNTTVHLVRRSVGKYCKPGHKKDGSDLVYWRGQLAKEWQVYYPDGSEGDNGYFQSMAFSKGRVVWFDAELFSEIKLDNMDTINLSNRYVGSIDCDVITAMSVIGQLQLASRHPGNTGASRQIAEKFARDLQEMVIRVAPENAELIEMGWNPANDC